MALKSVPKRSAVPDPPPAGADSEMDATAGGDAAQGLGGVLKHGISFPPERAAYLKNFLDENLALYDRYNSSRLERAVDSFDREMLHGLFEIIFLLHVNAPQLAKREYRVQYREGERPKGKKDTVQVADLYIEGAPHGVQGFLSLPAEIRHDFQEYTRSEFDSRRMTFPSGDYYPVVSIHSVGSTGTVGHKSGSSDLDLQVIYSLEPFSYDTTKLDDSLFREALQRESALWMRDFAQRKKIPIAKLRDPRIRQQLQTMSNRELAGNYPNLHKYLIRRQGDYRLDFQGDPSQALRIQCIHEMINLMKRSPKLLKADEMMAMEEKFRERLDRIQRYITLKFPTADIFLFPMSIDDYRKGVYSSTLEFKESSGSAYELILTQDTLMPGIQFTPIVPSHFIFPEEVNNNSALFNRLSDYIRFQAVELYDSIKDRLVNLGATGDLSQEYVARHYGAGYWEAFKASSGNLPKAFLNLLRYEMLLQKRYLKTIIQLIKAPQALDALVSPKPESKSKQKAATLDPEAGIANWNLLDLEGDFSELLQDPWWLRYKALKIAFAEEKGVVGLDSAERKRVSKVLDLAFALHVRISDVFTRPGQRREFTKHRELVLLDFLERAFPVGSLQRKQLEQIFIGDIREVNRFEAELRDLFKRCLARVRKKIAAFGLEDKGKGDEEFSVWYHYYRENFDAKHNMVERSIMNHLKVPRGRLRVGYDRAEGWFFKSLQRESSIGRRFDAYGMLDHLPDEVMLQEKTSFLAGFMHCIINGYYGVLNPGTLKERRTALEFDGSALDHGNNVHNTLAFLRPDQVERILDKVLKFFSYQDYDYLDIVREERVVTEVYIFLNLWEFGRLSILSRDNLRTYYCDEYTHPEMVKNATALCKSLDKLVRLPALQSSLGSFFDTRKILMDKVQLATWVNPNSIETNHAPSQIESKEEELAASLKEAIHAIHDYSGDRYG